MSPLRDPSRRHPTAVSNSIRIIETVAAVGIGVSAKEVAGALYMPAATAYRLLNALVADEYLVRTSDLRGFGLGAKLSTLISPISVPSLSTAALHCVGELRARVRFAVHVVGLRGSGIHVLDADPDHPMRAERELVRYLHASAAGKLKLAERSDWQILLPVPLRVKLTEHTVIDLDRIAGDLAKVRARQLAVQVDELELGLACTAVPLRDSEGALAGGLCLAGPSSRLSALIAHSDTVRRSASELAPLPLCQDLVRHSEATEITH